MTARARTAASIMTEDVPTIAPDATVAEALELLATEWADCAVVVDADGKPQGIVTELDLLSLAQEDRKGRMTHVLQRMLAEEHHIFDSMHALRKAAADKVQDIMSAPVRCAEADMSMAEAARIMEEFDYRQLPVVRDGRLVGLVRRQDIVRALAEDD